MSEVQALKVHVSVNVRNVEQSLDFYRRMLGIEPAKVRTGYAKYLWLRHAYYTDERRWPDPPFWARRHGETREPYALG